jgi:putative membrane protein
MPVLAQVFALVVAAVHVLAFVWEVLLFQRPGVHQGIFKVPTADVPAVRLWAFGVGFYNLFLACAPVIGVILLNSGQEQAGKALVLYACGFAFLSGFVLLAADRLELSRPRGSGLSGAASQMVPAAVVLIAATV